MQPSETSFSRRPERMSSTSSDEFDTARGSPEPAPITLERGVDGKLWLRRSEGSSMPVNVVRCFPWSCPRSFLSLRNDEGEELAFVEALEGLDTHSRAVLDATLQRASFVLDIVEIRAVTEDFELRSWDVITSQGERVFQTALDGWPRVLPEGGLVIEDVYGDLYRVARPELLDPRSRELLWAFVD